MNALAAMTNSPVARNRWIEKLEKLALLVLSIGLVVACFPSLGWAQEEASGGAWTPAEAPLMTRWAGQVSPASVKERPYPRPQMRRPAWKTLNGLWQYAFAGSSDEAPPFGESLDRQILVPFAVESALSGIGERTPETDRMWYRRTFTVPEAWASDQRILLHFGAVDWATQVYVNGQQVGQHKGGYDPFSVDVTDALEGDGPQELVVGVYDPTSDDVQPRGKQVKSPQGIWYTPVSGIWQTVWLEPVPAAGIQDLKMVPDIDEEVLRLTVEGRGSADLSVEAVAKTEDGRTLGRARGTVGEAFSVPVLKARLWTPETPHLYDLHVRLLQDGTVVDEVESYFGMREIEIGEGPDGKTRILLNDEFVFQYGPLDQGYWPDGLYTPPTDEAMRYDLEVTKKLGFNMVRKHVKVEPARWYYHADSLGLLVWQDMPSGIAGPGPEVERTAADEEQFEAELEELIDDFHNYPSIVMWIIFNEGWGQYDTERITQWAQEYDPSRLISNASGWTDRGVGDVRDVHTYPGPGAPPAEEDRAIVTGEFGGLGLPIAAHTWQSEDNWGYESYENPAALTDAYLNLLNQLHMLIGEPGLSGAVYTQTTDVEIEVNGLMTYDRDVLKMNTHRVAKANRELYEEPPPEVTTLVPTAEKEAATWRYTTEAPAADWMAVGFDDSAWNEGPGGFGSEGTPNAQIGTEWTSSDLWVRRTFTYDGQALSQPYLRIHHDDEATVYLNGQQIADLDGWTSSYTLVPLDEKAQEALREGQNTLAIHVQQDDGGQYIDAGLVNVRERSAR